MAGKFELAKYETADGETYPIRVQPETITASNPQGTGTVKDGFISVRKSRRAYGKHARYITISRPVGDGTDYNSAKVTARIPVFVQSAWEGFSPGATFEYQGKSDWKVVSKTNEMMR